jgi:hypothetical protein
MRLSSARALPLAHLVAASAPAWVRDEDGIAALINLLRSGAALGVALAQVSGVAMGGRLQRCRPTCLAANGVDPVQDQFCRLLRVADQREVTGVDLDCCRLHAFGQGPLKLR